MQELWIVSFVTLYWKPLWMLGLLLFNCQKCNQGVKSFNKSRGRCFMTGLGCLHWSCVPRVTSFWDCSLVVDFKVASELAGETYRAVLGQLIKRVYLISFCTNKKCTFWHQQENILGKYFAEQGKDWTKTQHCFVWYLYLYNICIIFV